MVIGSYERFMTTNEIIEGVSHSTQCNVEIMLKFGYSSLNKGLTCTSYIFPVWQQLTVLLTFITANVLPGIVTCVLVTNVGLLSNSIEDTSSFCLHSNIYFPNSE